MRIFNVCFLVFCSIAVFGQGQDTITFVNHNNRGSNRSDTTRMVISPEGTALHYYQYRKLLNTGDYLLKADGNPNLASTKLYLKKITPEDRAIWLEKIKRQMPVGSPMLLENSLLNVQPFTKEINLATLEGKSVILVFFSAALPNSYADFGHLNAVIEKMGDPTSQVIIAVSPDKELPAMEVLKNHPINHAILVSGASALMSKYKLNTFPTFIMTDKTHIIRLALSGSSPMVMPAFRGTIKQVAALNE